MPMKNIQVILLLLMLSVSAFSQTAQEQAYFDRIFRKTMTTPLPKGTKDKTIIFADKGYEISGKLQKNVPVTGTMIRITDTERNLTLYGKYILIDGKSAVHGKLDYIHDGNWVSSYGRFIVSNGAEQLIMKPKKASALSITDVQMEKYDGYWRNYPCILKKTPDGYFMSIDASTGGWYYKEFNANISETAVESFGYEDIDALILSDTLQVNIVFANGMRFLGNATGKSSEDGDIEYTLLDGEKTGIPGGQTVKVEKTPYTLKRYIMTTRNSESSKITEESLFLPSSMKYIDSDSLWIKSYYLKYSPSISIKYRNGDKYSGKFVIKDGNIIITDGTYLYKNGDKFEGDLSGEYFGGVPIDGKTTFRDGIEKDGNWMKEYSLTNNQFKAISVQKAAPSEVRKMAVSYVNENNYNKFVTEAEKYEMSGDFVQSKLSYEKALKYKNDTAISDKIKELGKKIEKQNLVKRYGSRYADNIMNGVIETGMTQEMCELVLSKAVGMEFYRVSSWMNFAGEQMETWEFDYVYGIEQENQKMLKKNIENNDKYAFLSYGFINAIGNLTSGVANSMAKYKYLKFRNSVLIELKTDDNKEKAGDALGTLLWLLGE